MLYNVKNIKKIKMQCIYKLHISSKYPAQNINNYIFKFNTNYKSYKMF